MFSRSLRTEHFGVGVHFSVSSGTILKGLSGYEELLELFPDFYPQTHFANNFQIEAKHARTAVEVFDNLHVWARENDSGPWSFDFEFTDRFWIVQVWFASASAAVAAKLVFC